ncbi:hypothetical protein GCM10008986_21010 [Salinibacillus aidingensis]|uniref:23S rRNA (Guanine745-N1)-methyltransferase n=1 Tax=Salinibacillus aidingensis TaxID=237684 RepID=A0ABN1BBM2_9BACI
MNKRIKSARQVQQHQSLFHCPICQSFMEVHESKSFICQKGHTFDFTKKGYINLTTRPSKTKYTKELFEARRELMVEQQLFEPLLEKIDAWIQNTVSRQDALTILDTGCGEGSHLARITEKLHNTFTNGVTGVGIDLSKEGIMTAAKNYPETIWAVADLAHSPFRDQSFQLLLNILSPSNYGEFSRLLKNGGYVLKVVPQQNYLTELRDAFFKDTDRASYSNDDTVDLFTRHFQLKDRIRVTYNVDLNPSSMQSLIQMTPLTWSISETDIQAVLDKHSLSSITVDLEILIGIKGHEK